MPPVGFSFATLIQSVRPEHGEVFTHTFQPLSCCPLTEIDVKNTKNNSQMPMANSQEENIFFMVNNLKIATLQ